MTNEELMRIYTADPDNAEDALVQLYEQNMDLGYRTEQRQSF